MLCGQTLGSLYASSRRGQNSSEQFLTHSQEATLRRHVRASYSKVSVICEPVPQDPRQRQILPPQEMMQRRTLRMDHTCRLRARHRRLMYWLHFRSVSYRLKRGVGATSGFKGLGLLIAPIDPSTVLETQNMRPASLLMSSPFIASRISFHLNLRWPRTTECSAVALTFAIRMPK